MLMMNLKYGPLLWHLFQTSFLVVRDINMAMVTRSINMGCQTSCCNLLGKAFTFALVKVGHSLRQLSAQPLALDHLELAGPSQLSQPSSGSFNLARGKVSPEKKKRPDF